MQQALVLISIWDCCRNKVLEKSLIVKQSIRKIVLKEDILQTIGSEL
jgi:hypothetical protein